MIKVLMLSGSDEAMLRRCRDHVRAICGLDRTPTATEAVLYALDYLDQEMRIAPGRLVLRPYDPEQGA